MEDADEHSWATKVGYVYCFERKLFVRMVNAVLDAISDDPSKLPSLYSESIPSGERLTERIDDNRNEWVFRFVGRRFRLSYHYCYKTSSTIKLCEMVDDNFDTVICSTKMERSDDIYDHPRISSEEDGRETVQLFCEMLAQRFPRDEADSHVP